MMLTLGYCPNVTEIGFKAIEESLSHNFSLHTLSLFVKEDSSPVEEDFEPRRLALEELARDLNGRINVRNLRRMALFLLENPPHLADPNHGMQEDRSQRKRRLSCSSQSASDDCKKLCTVMTGR